MQDRPDPITLYYAPGTISLASVIALEEAGQPYQLRRLDFASAEQRGADYLAINPKGRVPALVAGGTVLTETPAILAYIAATSPAAGLMPAAPMEAARVMEICCYLCSTVHVSHAHMRRGARWSDDPAVIDALSLKVPQNMAEHFAYLTDLIRGPWVMGSQYTIADPYLYTLAGWLGRDGVDIDTLPVIAAHNRAMAARPAVVRATEAMA